MNKMQTFNSYAVKFLICYALVLFFMEALALGDPVTKVKFKNKHDIRKCYRLLACINDNCICEKKDVIDSIYCWNENSCYIILWKQIAFNIFLGIVIVIVLLLQMKMYQNFMEKATPEEVTLLFNQMNEQFNERTRIHYHDYSGNLRIKMPGDNIPSYMLH
uniref:Uncharacterized protein n=1 Tax=Borely moumouvirus TaxID=2712067 RepID=A0A6G6AC91_9VIRU